MQTPNQPALLVTKFRRPAIPRHAVPRPALVGRLNDGLAAGRPLTLIAAPAGYGKTTLAAQWAAQFDLPVAWLTLDEADDDPLCFCSYLVAALQLADPIVGAELPPLLRVGQLPPPDVLATTLLNDLAATRPDGRRPLVCVLDDFHAVHSPVILAVLQALLAHPPSGLHLCLATREDPALPLARLRARGQLTEVRAADLRFAQAEAAAFLRAGMEVALSDADLARLVERTEGWAAGLQLAGLSLQGRADLAAFVETLSGSHRFILGYLTEEVLARQPVDVQEFLLQTSILDRLCGELCDAVTLPTPSPGSCEERREGKVRGEVVLQYLDRSNLFLIPLDDEGRWYRYHRLFAELLQMQLRRRSPDQVADLHRRASLWHEAHDTPVEAIGHALAAGEHGRAVELLERHGWALLNAGYVRTLEGWLNALPPAWRGHSPRLSLDFGWMYLLRGTLDRAKTLLAQAEAALETRPSAERIALQAESLALWANLLQAGGQAAEAIAAAERSLALMPPADDRLTALACLALGGAYRQLADFEHAVPALQSSIGAARRAGDPVTEMLAVAHLTLMAVQFGRLRLAALAATEALERLECQRAALPSIIGAVHGALGLVYYEWNDLPRAREHLQRGIRLGALSGHNASVIYSQCNLARLLQAEGDLAGAGRALDNAAGLLAQGAPGWVRPELIARQAGLALAQGDLAAAEARLRAGGFGPDDPVTHRTDPLHLVWLRLLMARRDPRSADLAQRVIRSAEAGGRHGALLPALILAAQLCAEDLPTARGYLERAVKLAEPEGAVRAFLDEGSAIAALLQQFGCPPWLAQALPCPQPPPWEGGGATTPLSPGRKGAGGEALVEPLSERELEVLRLLAEGLRYAEIAERLVVSLNTVRFHVKEIYGKLGVSRQAQAVARARELGLM